MLFCIHDTSIVLKINCASIFLKEMEEIGNYLNIFVAGRIVGPDRYLHLVPRTYEYVTHMAKEIFSDVTALGILK